MKQDLPIGGCSTEITVNIGQSVIQFYWDQIIPDCFLERFIFIILVAILGAEIIGCIFFAGSSAGQYEEIIRNNVGGYKEDLPPYPLTYFQ